MHHIRRHLPDPRDALAITIIVAVCILLIVSTARAQEVTVANHWHTASTGWHRTTVDVRPPHAAGTLPDGTRYVLGRQTGRDVWAVDLHLELEPREVRTLNLSTGTASAPPAVAPPEDIFGHFGGWAAVNGVPLGIVSGQVDGAAVSVHLRGRVGRTFVVDAWLDWRPDEPWLVTGEATLTSSNPAVPDVLEAVHDGGYTLTFGDSMAWGNVLAPAGDTFADGQARAVPVAFAWPRHAPSYEAWFLTVPQAVYRCVCLVGVRELWAGQGNPRVLPGLNPGEWTGIRYPVALSRIGTWEAAVTGPNMNSADSGAQGDQVFVAGECMFQPGPEQVHYLSALKLAARPNHLRRPDGSPMDPAEVATVQFWHGRPHAQSTHNLLGKSRGIEAVDAHGWWGPDTEHWLANGLTVAARVTGSRALQAELSQQARLYLMSQALPGPGHENWVTSGTDAARAIGWVNILAVHLWENLEDRALAARVRQRAIDRMTAVYIPQLTARGDYWDVRRDDPRLGTGDWWIPWQQSVGAYGLDLAGERFGVPEARNVALRGARAVLRDAWRQDAGRWLTQPQRPVDTTRDTLRDESFNYFGMSLAVATVLKHEPANATARSIWQQLLASATKEGDLSWLAPEVALAPIEPPAPTTATTVTQSGVSWTFASARPVGQFVNGDWWAVGPVTIVGITPGLQVSGGRTTGGSMLNPLPRADGRQAYDSKLYDPFLGDETGSPRWRPEMGVALPPTITTGSLISTTPQIGSAGTQLSALRTAAVLTVIDAVPPPDAFRPPYAGTDKTVRYRATDILAALPSLTAAPGAPSVDSVLAPFRASLFLDHFPNWTSRYMHPTEGLGDYYQTFTAQIGTAALLACSDIPDDQKRACTIVVAQLGIDNMRHMELGSVWGVNGHCNGRKFPILFAGKVLGDAGMLAAGVTWQPTQGSRTGEAIDATQPVRVPFSEDGQTFYVRETSPGVINWGFGGYTAAHIGLSEWGNFHLGNPAGDYAAWYRPGQNNYRLCCSAISWCGLTLCMRAMGIKDAWNQPAFFDYVDRYLQTETSDLRGDPWQARMWDMHRSGL